jgi:hypothetical protein
MDKFPSFLVYNIAKKLSGDELTLGVFKLFAKGLDQLTAPITLLKWLLPVN